MMLSVQQSRVMLFNQYYPYEDFIALYDMWLFIMLLGGQGVYLSVAESFVGVASGQRRFDSNS